METLKYDARNIEEHFPDCANLQEMVNKIEKELEGQGAVVCRVNVNGLQLSPEEETRFAQTLVKDIQFIEVQTQQVQSLIDDTLTSLQEFIHSLKDESVKAADQFRAGHRMEAQTLFTQVLSNAQWLLEALVVIKVNLQQAEKLAGYEEEWKTIETHMTHTATELAHAFEGNDFVLLSDVLEYELYNSLDKWLALIQKLGPFVVKSGTG